jgi:oxygen-dependent protoporphyrinogen oxidase
MRHGRPRVTVVGAGISGLSAAHHVRELAHERGLSLEVVVLESSERVGGSIRTERIDGCLIEGGPDALLAGKRGAVELCDRLGLGDEVAHLHSPETGTRILHRGRLRSLPRGFLMMAPTRLWPMLGSPLFSPRGKVRMAAERFVPARPEGAGDESLASFVTRRFGREALERAAEPIVASLFTADAERLSVEAVMPRFVEAERRHGSVTRAFGRARRAQPGGPAHSGHGRFAYLRGGLGRIVEALVARLPPDAIRTGVEIERVGRDTGAGFRVAMRAGADETDAVVMACPAHAAARLIAHHDSQLAAELGALRYASCATASLVYDRGSLRAPLDGFGFFVPRIEQRRLLACSFVSVKFRDRAPSDRVLLRAFLGGVLHPEIADRDDAEIARIADSELRDILGIRGPALLSRTHRFPAAMPQYEVGWPRRLEAIRERVDAHDGLFLAGGSVGAFGLPDCISSGERAAREVVDYLAERVPAGHAAAR